MLGTVKEVQYRNKGGGQKRCLHTSGASAPSIMTRFTSRKSDLSATICRMAYCHETVISMGRTTAEHRYAVVDEWEKA